MSMQHPPTPTPEQRRLTFLTAIKPHLTPTSFTGAGAVAELVSLIEDYGTADVDPQTRLEILTKMRDNAGNHYFRAWVENEEAMDITREWLKLAYAGKGDAQLVETIMPLLHVSDRCLTTPPHLIDHVFSLGFVSSCLIKIIDRLPLTIESLKTSKLGKIIVRLVKEPPAPGEFHYPNGPDDRPMPSFVCKASVVKQLQQATKYKFYCISSRRVPIIFLKRNKLHTSDIRHSCSIAW